MTEDLNSFEQLYIKTLDRISDRDAKGSGDIMSHLQFISEYVDNQDIWTLQAIKAFKDGYYLEVISISVNQINMTLRTILWMQAQLEIFQKYEKPWTDTYLFKILLDLDHPLGGRINDRDLYKEIYAKKLIDPKDFKRDLQYLYNERNVILHKLFLSPTKKADSAELKDLAGYYLNATSVCLNRVSLKSRQLQEEVGKMAERKKRLEF